VVGYIFFVSEYVLDPFCLLPHICQKRQSTRGKASYNYRKGYKFISPLIRLIFSGDPFCTLVIPSRQYVPFLGQASRLNGKLQLLWKQNVMLPLNSVRPYTNISVTSRKVAMWVDRVTA